MILTDREIQLALATGQVVITPSPTDDAFSSTSVDFTLDEPGEIWHALGAAQPIRPGARGYSYHQTRHRKAKIASLDRHVLEPDQFILGFTRETLELPIQSRLAARVEGKSGLARLGMVVHLTAPIMKRRP